MIPVTQHPDSIVHPRHILVATDLWDSNDLLPLAIAQAKAAGAHLTLAHAFTDPAILSISAEGLVPPDASMDAEEFAERHLAELVKRVHAKGVACDSVLRHGASVIEVLRDEIQRTGAERVIMGTHGRGLIGRFMLGSVARSLLRTLEIPIFAIGPGVHSPQAFVTPKRILHPVSLHGCYRENVATVRRLAEFYNAELILMHAINPDSRQAANSKHDLDWAKRQLDASIENPSALTVNLRTHVSYGEVIDEIIENSSHLEIEWIVLGWNEKRRNPAFVESAAYRVMAQAHVPVFTLPHRFSGTAAQAKQKTKPAVMGK